MYPWPLTPVSPLLPFFIFLPSWFLSKKDYYFRSFISPNRSKALPSRGASLPKPETVPLPSHQPFWLAWPCPWSCCWCWPMPFTCSSTCDIWTGTTILLPLLHTYLSWNLEMQLKRRSCWEARELNAMNWEANRSAKFIFDSMDSLSYSKLTLKSILFFVPFDLGFKNLVEWLA